MSEKKIAITAQVTPNPNTLKFLVDMVLIEKGSFNFSDKEAAAGSYLPEYLFGLEGVEGVMVGTNFVSVTKSNSLDWSDLAEPIIDALQDALSSGDPLLDEELVNQLSSTDGMSEEEQKIRTILDTEIRPAVAMDGGDIIFDRYEDGILTLQLQGACSSCPSSIMTLKMGIEARLKEEIPGLREVVQV
jgi:Fe-S cluster biogenesis protein NfuA